MLTGGNGSSTAAGPASSLAGAASSLAGAASSLAASAAKQMKCQLGADRLTQNCACERQANTLEYTPGAVSTAASASDMFWVLILYFWNGMQKDGAGSDHKTKMGQSR